MRTIHDDTPLCALWLKWLAFSCELFNQAYNHISERIDQVYKDLTKGKAAPMGGVAYLSLEDSEVHYFLPSSSQWACDLQSAARNLTTLVSSTTLCHR